MKHCIAFFMVLISLLGNAQNAFELNAEALGLVHSDSSNPFWFYANQNGRINQQTDVLLLASAKYRYDVRDSQSFYAGGGVLYQNGLSTNVLLDEFYAGYTYKWIGVEVGAWHRPEKYNGLSSVGGDLLWSNNARALPGIELKTLRSVKLWNWLGFRANLAHYEMTDDRFVENARVHHKSLYLDLNFTPRDRLSGGLDHYAQWGGTSPVFGDQPDGFSDFLKIFFGKSGGSGARVSDQVNALGNHLGSYTLNYSMARDGFSLEFYHQNIFEDRSGRELNNFPDGVWGLFIKPKNSTLFQSILYEYVQTVSQSGRFGRGEEEGTFSGGDNYFSNGTYRSGWTFHDRVIGMPFILINPVEAADEPRISNNRSIVHHLGLQGVLWKFDYRFKASYVQNLGTYDQPYAKREQAFYGFGSLSYATNFGTFNAQLGYDNSNLVKDQIGLGLGYSITLIP